MLVVEGSIPNEAIKPEGYWCGFGNNPDDRPADDHQRVAGPAGAQGDWPSWPSAPARPTAASTPWPATRPARWACPTTSAGTGSPRPGCRSSACPAARSTRTTCPRRSSTCSTRSPAQAPMIPLDEALRPTWLFGADRARGLRPRRLLRAGRVRRPSTARRSAWSSSAAGARSSSATCPSAAGSTASAAARTSAASASAARCPASRTSSCRSWTSRPAQGLQRRERRRTAA